jgi:hypothetical protein
LQPGVKVFKRGDFVVEQVARFFCVVERIVEFVRCQFVVLVKAVVRFFREQQRGQV